MKKSNDNKPERKFALVKHNKPSCSHVWKPVWNPWTFIFKNQEPDLGPDLKPRHPSKPKTRMLARLYDRDAKQDL